MGKLSPVDLIKRAQEKRNMKGKIQFTIQQRTINGTMGETNYQRFIT